MDKLNQMKKTQLAKAREHYPSIKNNVIDIIKMFAPYINETELPHPFEHLTSEINVLPFDDPEEGKVGITVFCNIVENNELKELCNILQFQVTGPITERKQIKSKKEFLEILNKAEQDDFIIEQCDNPAKLFIGFIIRKRSGNFYYYISLKDYKDES